MTQLSRNVVVVYNTYLQIGSSVFLKFGSNNIFRESGATLWPIDLFHTLVNTIYGI